MEVVVTGRHCEVSERFRSHVEEKLVPAREARPSDHPGAGRGRERTQPAPADRAVRVELTAFSKGPVIRAEAAAEDKMAALDLALDKMAAQMRRAADRRQVHRGRHTPVSVGEALAGRRRRDPAPRPRRTTVTERQVGPITVTGDGPLVVREKTHAASPMTLDQALYEMELVGPRLLPLRRQGERAARRSSTAGAATTTA